MILEENENLVDVSDIHEDPEAKPGPLEVCKAESCNHIRWCNLHTQSLAMDGGTEDYGVHLQDCRGRCEPCEYYRALLPDCKSLLNYAAAN